VIESDEFESAPDDLQPAGLLSRLPATVVDMAVYCGICALLAYPAARNIDWTVATVDPALLLDSMSEPAWIGHAAGVIGLWIALWWCYFAVGWGLLGSTIGKRVFGIVIVDHQGRFPIGLSRAFLRLAAYSISSVTLGMGHLLIALRPDRRALHDVLAGTWVVRRKSLARRARGNPKTVTDEDESPSDPDGAEALAHRNE
jgi:uncharacterized RDD family membrane protein YckC